MRLNLKLRANGPLRRLAAYIEQALNLLAEEIERVERGRPRLNSGVGVLIDEGPDGFTITSTSQGGGGDAAATDGALVLTSTAPPAYFDMVGPMPEGTPVFVSWGTAGGVIPAPETFTSPIGYVTAAGTRYVWAEIGLSEAVPFLATSLALVSSVSPTGYATPAFGAGGEAPAVCYVPLGNIVATGAGADMVVTLNNAGRGSISVGIGIVNAVIAADTNRLTSLVRNLSYWRVDAR